MLRMFCVVLLTLSLSACGEDVPSVVKVPDPIIVHVPEELRSCPAIPATPVGDYTQRDVADYVARLHITARECKVNLNAVDGILDEAESRVSGS